MTTIWHYEYEGRKVGPVPASTIRHLAAHGAISRDTMIWKGESENAIPAYRLKNLFPDDSEASTSIVPGECLPFLERLTLVLNAIRDGVHFELADRVPPIIPIESISLRGVLLDFQVVTIAGLPTPRQDQQVKNVFRATVNIAICDRPMNVTEDQLEQLWQRTRRCELVEFEGKEMQDGSWVIIDQSCLQ